jgi:sugar lactone lactonase YvrE
MRSTTRAVAAVALAAATVLAATVLAAAQGSPAAGPAGRTRVFTLDPSTHGNPEGVAVDRDSGRFFVGTVGDGTIYRGSLGRRSVTPFIAGAPGAVAVGMKVSRGLLYVAGGPTQKVSVYDVRSGKLRASIAVPGSGFLNDLVVTQDGDVWVTDSFVPTLWHVARAQVKAGTGTATGLPVGPEITFAPNVFNLNGIAALSDDVLLVVDSNTGNLWRIALGSKGSRTITKVRAPAVKGGDGMLLDGGRLVVVQGDPAQLSFLALANGGRRATLTQVRTDPALRGPSTVARDADRYLVVNADFTTSTTPFTVAGLAR